MWFMLGIRCGHRHDGKPVLLDSKPWQPFVLRIYFSVASRLLVSLGVALVVRGEHLQNRFWDLRVPELNIRGFGSHEHIH